MSDDRHPRDKFITVYGRKPVLEALQDESLTVDKVVLADNVEGGVITEITREAKRRKITIERATEAFITKLARNGKQHQGVVADVIAPRMQQLSAWLNGNVAKDATVLVLDGVNNPANVGMIVRSVVAAGIDGVVLPRQGCPDINPVVIKASAGVAFGAEILRCERADEALELLHESGFIAIGLDAPVKESIYEPLPKNRIALVLGNETEGVSMETSKYVDEWRRIPMPGRAESLNVSSAAAVVLFELVRQRST